jgi:hypothetical protein
MVTYTPAMAGAAKKFDEEFDLPGLCAIFAGAEGLNFC